MEDPLVNRLAHFAWEAFGSMKPAGATSPDNLIPAAESVTRLLGDDPIHPSLDGLGEQDLCALRVCIELDPANADQMNEAVVALARAFEPFIKRLLARVDATAFAKYRRSNRSFDLSKALSHLGLGLPGNIPPNAIDGHESPQREIDWAYVARNDCAHGAPKWSRADRDRRREALVAGMVLAAFQHHESLTAAHAAVDWSELTHRILDQSSIDQVRSRFVTLIAGEQALAPVEPTASEMVWIDPLDTGTPAADDDDAPDDEGDSDDEMVRDGPLFGHRRGKVAQLILDIGRFLLVGRPGAGKTTSLRMLEWQLAKDLAEGTQPLAPVLVELKRCRPSSGAGVLTLAERRMGVDDARQVLADGEVVLLLDGVNEVAESEFDAVQIEIDEILCEYPNLPVVITSRPSWHRNQARLPVFALDPLDDARIEEFLQKNMRPEIVPAFLADLRSFPKLWTLARNPLTLAMLCRVGEESGGIVPENRAIVLRLFFEWMADREARKGSQTDRNVKSILLARIAWAMRTDGVMTLSAERTLRILAAVRSELGLGVSVDDFLDEVADNGFLQHVDGEVAFEHEVFLDFFAATELARHVDGNPTIATELSEQPRWRETVLLAYGLGAPTSEIRSQVTAGRPSIAAEALLEQKETTVEQRVALARSISTRTGNHSSDVDVLLSLIALGDGDALLHWFLGNRHRSSILRTLDPSSVEVATAIHAMLALLEAEREKYPSRTDPMIDSQGEAFRHGQRPGRAFFAFVRSLPGTVPPEMRLSLEHRVLEVSLRRLPGYLRWDVPVQLSAFLPSFLIRDDLTATRGRSLARLCHVSFLQGKLWRAMPAYVELATTHPPPPAIERPGPPITAGRDWIRLIKDGVVAERETKNLLDWIEKLLEARVSDDALVAAFTHSPRLKIFDCSEKPAHVFLRCLGVLTALVPYESQLADHGLTQPLWMKARHPQVSVRGLLNAFAAHVVQRTPLAKAGGEHIRASVLALHRSLSRNVAEVVYAARGVATPLPLHGTECHSASQLRVPSTEEEAAIFDRIHVGRRFFFTVIAARPNARYRFLKIEEGGGLSAFYWPPDDAAHPTLAGGERVSAEVRSTWIKKKECWGIKALHLQVHSAPRVFPSRPVPESGDSPSRPEPETPAARVGSDAVETTGTPGNATHPRPPLAKSKKPVARRSLNRRDQAASLGHGLKVISWLVLLVLAVLLLLTAFAVMTVPRDAG